MKAMIVSDFAVLRSALLQLLGICLVIALFMGYVMGAVGTAAAIAAMIPFTACSASPPMTSRTTGSASASRCPSLAAKWCSDATPPSPFSRQDP